MTARQTLNGSFRRVRFDPTEGGRSGAGRSQEGGSGEGQSGTGHPQEGQSGAGRPQEGRARLKVERHRRTIKNLGHQYDYFVVASTVPIREDDLRDLGPAEVGDICAVKLGQELDIWLFTDDGRWEKTREGKKHPTLKDYQLHLHEGSPRWIQSKSVRTYGYRSKQQILNLSEDSQDSSI